MTALLKGLISGWVCAAFVWGQSLQVPPSETDRNTPGIFSVILDAPAGRAPVALQWELSVPPAVAIETADITAGKAAVSARKSLTCAVRGDKMATQATVKYACILAGGQDAIGTGPVVMVRYRAQTDVHGAPIRVAIQNVLGVSANLQRIEIPNVDAMITIR